MDYLFIKLYINFFCNCKVLAQKYKFYFNIIKSKFPCTSFFKGDAAAKKRLVDDIDFYKAKPYDFNFRVHNIKMVSKQMTRYPPMRVAHTRYYIAIKILRLHILLLIIPLACYRKGDTFSLMGSGLFPTYVYSEKYGKVPTYIVKRAEEMALAKQVGV